MGLNGRLGAQVDQSQGSKAVQKRIMAMAWLLVLALYAAVGRAATPLDARFLDRLDAYRSDGSIEIVIGLTQALRYVSHTQGPRGEVLRIQLLSVNNVPNPIDAINGQRNLRWTGRKDVPLDEVLTDSGGNTPTLILRFTHSVVVQSVRVDPDNRSVSVTIEGPQAAPEPVTGPLPETPPATQPGSYVVNLASARTPLQIDAGHSALAVDGRRIYQSVARVDGQPVYRLRLGFFPNQAAALAVSTQLAAQYPGAWVSQVTTLEQGLVEGGATLVDPSKVMVDSDVDKTLPAISLERLAALMEEARQAVAEGNAARAIVIYNRVTAYPVSPYREDAQELLGVAHEKKGQLALAKAAYQDYLQRYPEGAGADRVRQRLAGLVTAAVRPRERLRAEPEKEGELARWDVFGSAGQYYRRDFDRINSADLQTTQSLLSNLLDVSARRRGEGRDLGLRFTGSYDHDFVNSADSQLRLATAYADYGSRDQSYLARVGRQTRSSGGVLGRFDGLNLGYKLADDYRLNLVAGAPVLLTEDGFNSHQRFYGASVDAGPYWDDWNVSLYGIRQDVDGLTDRTAVGSELRYFTPGRSLFGLVDYDVYFNALNIFYAIGSWNLDDQNSFNVVLDYRKSPLLSTSNALQGQTVTTVQGLTGLFSDQQIKQLAIDRTATSKSLTGGVSHVVDSHWQVGGDITVTTLSGTPASGGVDATPSAGPDYYYNLQFVGADLYKNGDLAIIGLRYSDTTTGQAISATLNARYPVNSSWRVNPLLRLDYRWNTGAGTQTTAAPAIRATYVYKRFLTVDLEGGAEVLETQQAGISDLVEIYYVYVGYRYDF